MSTTKESPRCAICGRRLRGFRALHAVEFADPETGGHEQACWQCERDEERRERAAERSH
jgi:ribosomal protein L34E